MALMVSTIPMTTVSAAVTVSSEADLLTQINAGNDIKLANNIELSSVVSISRKSITIDGQGHKITLVSSVSDRHFKLTNSAQLTLDNVTIEGNSSTVGGGISAKDSTIIMNSSALKNCTATKGGGVYITDGSLNMSGYSTISGNNDSSNGSGGGGVYLSGTLTMNDNSSISDNSSSAYGGGVVSHASVYTSTIITMNVGLSVATLHLTAAACIIMVVPSICMTVL